MFVVSAFDSSWFLTWKIVCFWEKTTSLWWNDATTLLLTFFVQVPNNVSLVRENLPPVVLDRYRARRRNVHIYRAAVQLWGEGLSFDRALSIVAEAFDAATYEAWMMVKSCKVFFRHDSWSNNVFLPANIVDQLSKFPWLSLLEFIAQKRNMKTLWGGRSCDERGWQSSRPLLFFFV